MGARSWRTASQAEATPWVSMVPMLRAGGQRSASTVAMGQAEGVDAVEIEVVDLAERGTISARPGNQLGRGLFPHLPHPMSLMVVSGKLPSRPVRDNAGGGAQVTYWEARANARIRRRRNR